MAEKKVMLTQDGYDKLVEKLEYLKSVRRIEVANRLKAAIALGDLSENSEYDDAKNEQAFLEGEILDLEAKIVNSEIIQEDKYRSDVVNIGSRVVIREIEEIKNRAYAKIKNLFKVVDGQLQEISFDEANENEMGFYKIVGNEFIEINKGDIDSKIDKERAYKLISINADELTGKVDDSKNVYKIIDGGFIEFSEVMNLDNEKLYKVTEGNEQEIYGKIDRSYNIYQIADDTENEKYRIVGSTETNPDEGKISDESPVGSALMGKKVGSIAEVHSPVGIIQYEIVEIEA